jgi:hypothetical protein
LSSEEVRDSMLAASGALDLRVGGSGFRLYRYLQDNVATYVPLDEVGPETYRRAVYHQNARAAPVDLMAEFDSPDCSFSTPKRAETTTPLQALATLNHPCVAARRSSKRVEISSNNNECLLDPILAKSGNGAIHSVSLCDAAEIEPRVGRVINDGRRTTMCINLYRTMKSTVRKLGDAIISRRLMTIRHIPQLDYRADCRIIVSIERAGPAKRLSRNESCRRRDLHRLAMREPVCTADVRAGGESRHGTLDPGELCHCSIDRCMCPRWITMDNRKICNRAHHRHCASHNRRATTSRNRDRRNYEHTSGKSGELPPADFTPVIVP